MGPINSLIFACRKMTLCSFIILALLSWGCMSHKGLTTHNPLPVSEGCAPGRYLQASGCSISFSSDSQKISSNGDFYIDRDSSIFFRATLLIELARGIITQDSFSLINRLNRSFYQKSLTEMENITFIPVSPSLLSHLLTASPCIESFFEKSTLQTQKISEDEKIIFLKEGKKLTLNTSMGLLKSIKYSGIGQDAYLLVKYSNFISTVHGSTLPTVISLESRLQSGMIITILIEVGRWDEGIKKLINFVIPARYTREEF